VPADVRFYQCLGAQADHITMLWLRTSVFIRAIEQRDRQSIAAIVERSHSSSPRCCFVTKR